MSVAAPAVRASRRLDQALSRPVAADLAVCLGIALALSLLAFTAQGGTVLEPNTWAQILLVVAGCGAGGAALAAPHRRATPAPLHGGRTLGLFGIVALLTALSIGWSLDPDSSWLEAHRTLSYLAAFGGTLALVRVIPHRWGAVLGGIALACVIVCGWALLTKVFPDVFAEGEVAARLRAPFGYWNATGLMAALGVPPLVWLGSRRAGHAALNALAHPGIGLLIVTMMLAYSRGALLALALGLAAWFAVVPLRLRGAITLIVPSVAAAGVLAWAFSADQLTREDLEPFQRVDAGHALGLLLGAMLALLLVAGLAIGFWQATRTPTDRVRRLAGRAIIGALGLAAVAAVIGFAAAPGGIGGQISESWKKMTDPMASTPANTPNRLITSGSVRARYWDEGFKIHAGEPWLGTGAGSYGTARQFFRTASLDVQHAHGYVVQTLSDLGWAGLIASLAALGAWLAAAAGVLGLRRRDRGLPWDAERVGLATLGTVVLVFGIHSGIDWTWFIPANAVLAIVAAGWIAGRPPLRTRLASEGPTGGMVAAERTGILPPRPAFSLRARLLGWQPSRYRSLLALCVLGVGVAVTWSIVQPLRAQNALDAASARLDAGRYASAEETALRAHELNPLSVEPWFLAAFARSADGEQRGAVRALTRAIETQPANAETWRRLGEYQFSVLNDPKAALRSFNAAYYLDKQATGAVSDVLKAARASEALP